MKTAGKLMAGVAVMATLLTASVFAEPRHRPETNAYARRDRTVTVEGRIRDIDRERNGFVIRIDRGAYRLFLPVQANVHSQDRRRTRARDLERGDRIRVTGTVHAHRTIFVETVQLLRGENDRWDRDDRTLRGVVHSVDYARRVVWVREDRTGRTIAVDVRRDDIRDVRRGDRILVSGDWRRDGRFEAERLRIENGRW